MGSLAQRWKESSPHADSRSKPTMLTGWPNERRRIDAVADSLCFAVDAFRGIDAARVRQAFPVKGLAMQRQEG